MTQVRHPVPIGDRYGRLVVLGHCFLVSTAKHIYWSCRCDCGRTKSIYSGNILRGRTRSCGCRERMTHGDSHSAEYSIRNGMISRCHNPHDIRYADYGGRGISVCDQWRTSYQSFLEHVGRRPSPSHSIDRISNDGNYEPGNVRWSTSHEQRRNTRQTHNISFGGVTRCVRDWARELGIHERTIHRRLKRGWTTTQVLYGNGYGTGRRAKRNRS